MSILFVDQINFSSLPRIWGLGRSLQTIRHFEPIALSAQRWLRVFRRLRLVRAEIRQIEHHVGQVRNDAGESEYAKLLGYARAICSKIKREQLANNPLIKAMGSEWATSRVVFDDWESPRAAVERYRSAPEARPEFGDWSPEVNDLDPFRDGQASLRMGVYIRWVYEALKQSASKQAALATATEQFAQRWGNRHVTLIVRLRIMR